MEILTKNLEFLSKLNQSLVAKLEAYHDSDENNQINKKKRSIVPYDLPSQHKELVYLQCGHYSIGNIVHGLSESEAHSAFKKRFGEGSINSETYSEFYADVHEDVHIGYFIDLIRTRAQESTSIRLTKQPNRRSKPTFLVLNGLAGRENLKEFITDVSPRHVFACENEIELVYDFLNSYSIESIRDHCQSSNEISFSISIGCGSPDEHINEIKGWIASHNELATEGLLISNSPSPSIKKEAMKKFLTTDSWHIDTINNMGYQLDEYNMLANTSSNFNSLKHRIYLSKFCSDDSLSSLPVVITGSGPSLDSSLPFLAEHRDKFILVSGGSSISTLLEFGIKPDIHVQLERSEHQYGLHLDLSKKFPLNNILLIASSTVPSRHQELFDHIIYFFRPALSPLALYASNSGEILSAEGPDTINAAVASIGSLGFKNIALFGVDCGSASKAAIRSKGAFGGYIPRNLTKVERGSRGSSIFTNPRLQNVRNAISWSLKLNKINAANFSNGLKILNTSTHQPDEFSEWLDSKDASSLSESFKVDLKNQILNHMLEINQYRLNTSWDVADPRQKIFDFCREFEKLVEKSDDIRDIVKGTRTMISLTARRATKSHQLVPRIVRGTLGKMCPIMISFYNSTVSDDPQKDVLPFVKSILLEFIDLMESDLYSVIDYIEPNV